MSNPSVPAAETPAPAEEPVFSDIVTGEIVLEPLSCYCVQVAYFRDRENAASMLAAQPQDGASAYIWQDADRYRVLDTASGSRESAQARADALRQASLAEPCLIRQSIPGSRLTVTAGKGTLACLEGASACIADAVEAWLGWTDAYDAGKLDGEALCVEIADRGQELRAWAEEIGAHTGAGDPAGVAGAMAACLEGMHRAGEEVLVCGTENPLAFSEELRYNQMEVLYCYNLFMTEINPPS